MTRQTLVHEFLERNAELRPAKVAFIQDDARYTYHEINTRANHLAAWLLDNGITPGERVAIFLENSIEYVVSYYGALKAGAVAVPLNSTFKSDILRRILEDVRPRTLITSRKFEKLFRELAADGLAVQTFVIKGASLSWQSVGCNVAAWEDTVRQEAAANPRLQLDETLLASIVYTSGSTGSPKGVMLSHRNLTSNTLSIIQYLQLNQNDIQMVVLPFYYVMGKSLLNTHFAVGGTVVANNRFAYPASVLDQMHTEGVTGFSGVPSTYAYLLHRSPLTAYCDKLETLRYCSQAGGHMSRQIKERLLQALPAHTKLYVMYGATEAAARLSYVEPEHLCDKLDSIGKPIPGVTIKVMDETGKEVAPGVSGELVAQGPNIMQGYWKDPEATSRVLDAHGYHTGDLGHRDEDGYFYVTGRKDNLLKVGGHRINPQEIEAALMATDLLVEVAVFGVEDRLLGQKMVALAVPVTETTAERNILASCLAKLPRYKIPTEIKLVGSIPKNSHGKIDRMLCLASFNRAQVSPVGQLMGSSAQGG